MLQELVWVLEQLDPSVQEDPPSVEYLQEGVDQNPDSTIDFVANKKADNDNANKQRELDLKAEDIRAKERMNTENNKTALKNKVSGEK